VLCGCLSNPYLLFVEKLKKIISNIILKTRGAFFTPPAFLIMLAFSQGKEHTFSSRKLSGGFEMIRQIEVYFFLRLLLMKRVL